MVSKYRSFRGNCQPQGYIRNFRRLTHLEMVVQAYDSVRRELVYNPTALRITVKLLAAALIKMKPTVKSGKANTCRTYFLFRMACNKAMIYRHCCQLCLSIRHEKRPQDGLKLNGTSQLLVYADYVCLSCEKRNKALLQYIYIPTRYTMLQH